MAGNPNEIISLLSDESFQRWLTGDVSSEENEKWQAWLIESQRNKERYDQALEIWNLTQYRNEQVPEIGHEWNKLKSRLHFEGKESISDKDYSAQEFLSYKRRQRRDTWIRFGAVAFATIVLIFVMVHFVQIQKSKELAEKNMVHSVSTEFGQRTTLNLPDGSHIILNANSTISYPAVWNETTRHIFELQGEAYFDVASHRGGPQRDFIVHTNDGKIKVVGTRFVVYERGKGTRVAVEEGKVEVAAEKLPIEDVDFNSKVLLKSGHLLQFETGSRNLVPRNVNVKPFTTWWRRQMILDKTPFGKIVQRLEETYGIQVEVRDNSLLKRTISGSIENQNLDIVTEALAKALRIPVSRNGQVIIFGISTRN